MKALLLAATSSLALTGFAMAQTATDSATTTDSSAVPATGAPTEADSAATGAGTNAGSSMDAATSGSAMDAGSPAATGADSPDAAGAAATGTSSEAGASMDSTGAGSDMTTGTATDSMGTAGSTATTGTTTTDTTATDTTTTTAPVTTTTTDMTTTTDTAGTPAAAATVLTADNPGMLGSWIMNRRIWTTNQPSSTAWESTTLTERPAEWTDIAKVDDIVVSPEGDIVGYVADIGGFLGLGAKSVLLNPDALHFVQIGDDAFFATNYTREELEALPDFDTTTVMR